MIFLSAACMALISCPCVLGTAIPISAGLFHGAVYCTTVNAFPVPADFWMYARLAPSFRLAAAAPLRTASCVELELGYIFVRTDGLLSALHILFACAILPLATVPDWIASVSPHQVAGWPR